MAVDAVLGEPVSGQIPCYQGNLQGILQNSPRQQLAGLQLSQWIYAAYHHRRQTWPAKEQGIKFDLSGNCFCLAG
jgi:hypothetical protein